MSTERRAAVDPAVLSSWQRLHAVQTATFAQLEPSVQALGARGWTIPTFATPQQLVLVTALAHGDADHGFSVFYEANGGQQLQLLRQSLQASEPLAAWQPLLMEAFTAYAHGLFRVAVPALVTVLDAAVSLLGGRLTTRADVTRVAAETLRGANDGLARTIAASLHAFLLVVFRPHDFASAPPTLLNRHWVLHGRDTRAWTQADCLRLFQAIDTIGALLTVAAFDPLAHLSPELAATLRELAASQPSRDVRRPRHRAAVRDDAVPRVPDSPERG
jgi:hypothetical protein